MNDLKERRRTWDGIFLPWHPWLRQLCWMRLWNVTERSMCLVLRLRVKFWITTTYLRFPRSDSKRHILRTLNNCSKHCVPSRAFRFGQLQSMGFLCFCKGFCIWCGDSTDLCEWCTQQWPNGLPVIFEFDVQQGHGEGIFDFDQRKDPMVSLHFECFIFS